MAVVHRIIRLTAWQAKSRPLNKCVRVCAGWEVTLCWTPPNWWVLVVRAFFFLASSSCFFRCSSISFLSFSSCRGGQTRQARGQTQWLDLRAVARLTNSPPDEPASPSPARHESSAAPLSPCDASPARTQEEGHMTPLRLAGQSGVVVLVVEEERWGERGDGWGRTILLTRASSSPSAFCLWMKWASIRDVSSAVSFSWRFLWMSWKHTHTGMWLVFCITFAIASRYFR